ncbi:MAG: type IV-A pilus assembly ATPase PilB [Candidatus Competibacteraceae bacterium]
MATILPESKSTQTVSKLSGLARQLVRAGLLDEAVVARALEQTQKQNIPLVTYLVEHKLAQAGEIARIASSEFGLPLFDLNALEIDPTLVQLVDERLIRQYHALPLWKRGNRLFVALADPSNLRALEDIKFKAGVNTEPIVVVETELKQCIERALEKATQLIDGMLDSELDNIDVGQDDDNEPRDSLFNRTEDDTPVVRFINRAILDAINRGASDLHFEPYEKIYRVRFRQDGVLQEVAKPPVNMSARIAARLKVMAQLNIAERRVPQDGRMKLYLSKQRAIDFRVNTLPTLWGEKIVLRILDPTSAQMGIEALGYEPHQKELFLKAIHKPQGMVLVTGPTGSGKTVSLYTALNILNTAEVNISTAEDPVEINLAGINQVNVNVKTGMTFAEALRAFLRQDPDIIMVGEVRDLETAEIAIKAAQTGHLVLSTLHTNSAPETVTRLMNMGVAPFNIASSVTLIIAQRLARKLCTFCKEEDKIPQESLLKEGFTEKDQSGLVIYRPVGCEQCNNGYKGRTGIYEVMPISKEMERIIMAQGNALQIAEQAQREGISDLRRSGLNKVRQGIIGLEELNRVTKD